MTDVCEHGRPDHQELIAQLLEALGMGTHARAVTPRELFERCLAEIRTLRSEQDHRPEPLAFARFHRYCSVGDPDSDFVELRAYEDTENLHIDGVYALYRRTDRPAPSPLAQEEPA